MKSAEKFLRELHADGKAAFDALCASLPRTVDAKQLGAVGDALAVLEDAITILADHDKQAKARAERIQWIHVAAGVYVTRAGRNTFRLMEDGDSLSLQIDNGGVGCVSFEEIDTTTSIESASRKIRAWRKKQ